MLTKHKGEKVLSLPTAATYVLKNDTNGFADGIITVEVDTNSNSATDIIPYWADDNGKLENYNSLYMFQITGSITVFEIASNVIIPRDATRLLLYAYNYDEGITTKEYFEIPLQKNKVSNVEFGKCITEFQVISDIHIQDDKINTSYKRLLEKVAQISPESSGLFIVGDITNNGRITEYEKHKEIYATVQGLPNYYIAIGNHEFYNGGQAAQKQIEKRFVSYAHLPDYTSPNSQHYDFWLNGYHYIFLGNDGITPDLLSATFTDETMLWFYETLMKDRNLHRPTFVFCHYPVKGTVAGSLGEFTKGSFTGVWGENADKLKLVLKDFPEVVMFTGHQHFILGYPNTMHKCNDELPTIFNTASASQTANCRDGIKKKGSGSEGYFVYVYEDKVIVKGYDFISDKWILSAQFYVDFNNS